VEQQLQLQLKSPATPEEANGNKKSQLTMKPKCDGMGPRLGKSLCESAGHKIPAPVSESAFG